MGDSLFIAIEVTTYFYVFIQKGSINYVVVPGRITNDRSAGRPRPAARSNAAARWKHSASSVFLDRCGLGTARAPASFVFQWVLISCTCCFEQVGAIRGITPA